MSNSFLKLIVCLAGVGAGLTTAGFSFLLLLLAWAFIASGGDVGFERGQISSFAVFLIGGVSGVIAGGFVFKQPGVSTAVFSAAAVFSVIAAIPLIELGLWLFAPGVIFGVGALISWVVSQRRTSSYPA